MGRFNAYVFKMQPVWGR